MSTRDIVAAAQPGDHWESERSERPMYAAIDADSKLLLDVRVSRWLAAFYYNYL